jgi:hypothetical protein
VCPAWAGDLTVEGSLNVTSNLTAANVSASNLVASALEIRGDAAVRGIIRGDGSGITNLAAGSVSASALATGAVTAVSIVNNSIGTNKVVAAEWNAWADGRYASATGMADLVMQPGRTVAGTGFNLTNIVVSAYGAEQRGVNNGTQTIAAAAQGAEQRGYNSGMQIISSIARGAEQRGQNYGTMVIGSSAYGAGQRGYLNAGAVATNIGKGSVQFLNLSSGQTAYMKGNASIGLGACVVTNDQAIVAGDGLASRGNGTVTAVKFYGDGSGLTNLLAATVQTNSITAEKLATDAVTSLKIQNGTIIDADISPTAAIAQTKIAGLSDMAATLTSHLAAFDNPHRVTAAQIGALTNESDGLALFALNQYAVTNKVLRWQDSSDPNVWWVVNGGTNVTVWKRLSTPVVSFSADFCAGDGSTPPSSTYGCPFFDSYWSCVPALDLSEIWLSAPNGDRWGGVCGPGTVSTLPEEVVLTPYSGGGHGEAYVRTVGIVGSFNLVTGDVWTAIACMYPSSNPSNYIDAASASSLISQTMAPIKVVNGDGSSLTNLNLAVYAGHNLTWDPTNCVLNAAGGVDSNSLLSVVASVPSLSRIALGLGSAATCAASDFAPVDLSGYASDTVTYSDGHFHAASQLASSDVTNAVLTAWPQLDTNASNDLTTAGGTLVGDLNMNSNRVTNLSAPSGDGDAVSKAYLRSVLSSLEPQGDLSMGSFTNGAPVSFPLTFNK